MQTISKRFRIVTYNVRRCLGMDGALSPQRIARVLAECDADVIALQELDVGRLRSERVDQAHAIASELAMSGVHFHPAMRVHDELYGDAVLTTRPSRLVRAGPLPAPGLSRWAEPRGALWVSVDVEGTEVQVVNTHLGLGRIERRAQAAALLGPDWLGHPDCKPPVVMTGDLNSLPRGRVYRLFASRMRDVQAVARPGRIVATFPSSRPWLRIDHMFVSEEIEVGDVQVWRSPTARMASDHLPLIADLWLSTS